MNVIRPLLILTLAIALVFSIAPPALADRYRAGNFTVTIYRDAERGYTYRGCDRRGRCLFLTDGTEWQDEGWRGIIWENDGYSYSVGWQEGTTGAMYLRVVDPQDQRIVDEPMTPLD